MIWIRVAIILFISFSLLCCEKEEDKNKQKKITSPIVDIIQLRLNPSDYIGKRVAIIGYLRENGGWLKLYPTRDDGLMRNSASAISFEDSTPGRDLSNKGDCLDSYVSIIGTYGRMKMTGAYGINSIERVEKFKFVSEKQAISFDCWVDEKGEQ